jgi:hypothetical protein
MSAKSEFAKAIIDSAKRAGIDKSQPPPQMPDEAAQAYRGQRISTRVPTAQSATENFLTDNLIINRKSLEDAPKAFDINTEFVSRYPTVKTDATTSAGRADAFTAEAVDNLIWLYNQAPPAVRNIGKNWYVGANRIAGELAEKYGISHESASAVLAALSPQKDWYQNVSLAERVINGYKKSAGKMLDADSLATAREIYSDPKFANNIEAMANMPFDELDDVQKAMYVRSLDQTHNDRGYQMINPNGDRVGQAFSDKTGKPNTTAWGSNSEIAKAIRVIEDPSIENISRQMGGAHKVRNFYNNISDPTYAIDNPELGDVTIDTHAVAADQIMPLSGNSVPVGAAFGTTKGVASSAQTGARGTYGLHADAYRIAARELGIQPRELQSVTWETVRSLFPASFKTKGNVSEINGIWELYNTGKISKGLARELILDKASGIPDPDWAAGLNTAASGPRGLGANTGELSFSGVPGGQTAGRANAGRNLLAAGFSTGFLGALGIGYTEPAQAGPGSKAFAELAKRADAGDQAAVEGIRAYHGSPYSFDEFSTSQIGTGEGAQAYGRGLYFAEREKTAEGYRDALKGNMVTTSDGVTKTYGQHITEVEDAIRAAHPNLNPDNIRAAAKSVVDDNLTDADVEGMGQWEGVYKSGIAANKNAQASKGSMYEVNIAATPDEFIDWDLPLDEQSESVMNALNKTDWYKYAEEGAYEAAGNRGDNPYGMDLVRWLEEDGAEDAAQMLKDAGIKGIQYADAQTRFGKGPKTKNYVVYDDKLISIAKKYGISIPAAAAVLAGTMTPEEAQAVGFGSVVKKSLSDKTDEIQQGIGSLPAGDEMVTGGDLQFLMNKLVREQSVKQAKEQGYDLDNVMYHASKQDIEEFVPGYSDGLVFLTPNKEFANDWLGKGKFQERQGGTGSIEGVRAEKKRFMEEANNLLKSLPKDQRQQYFEEILNPQQQQLIKDERLADSAIYPVVTRTKKPFVPSKDVDVLEELYGKEYLDAPFGSGFPTYKDALKDGNYLLYENKEVVDFLKSKGYDSMFLKESSGADKPFTTLAVFDPNNIRSVNAKFDPEKKDSPQILASAPFATGITGLGAMAALPSEEAEAGVNQGLVPFDKDIHTSRDVGLGGLSSEYTMTVDAPDGQVAVIPSIWWDTNGEPVVLDQRDAERRSFEYEQETGKQFPRFPAGGYELADEYAQARTRQGGASESPLASEYPSLGGMGVTSRAMPDEVAFKAPREPRRIPEKQPPGIASLAGQLGLGAMSEIGGAILGGLSGAAEYVRGSGPSMGGMAGAPATGESIRNINEGVSGYVGDLYDAGPEAQALGQQIMQGIGETIAPIAEYAMEGPITDEYGINMLPLIAQKLGIPLYELLERVYSMMPEREQEALKSGADAFL